MFTKAICKNYAISAVPGYPGIAGSGMKSITCAKINRPVNMRAPLQGFTGNML
jgi:hypothetical protein